MDSVVLWGWRAGDDECVAGRLKALVTGGFAQVRTQVSRWLADGFLVAIYTEGVAPQGLGLAVGARLGRVCDYQIEYGTINSWRPLECGAVAAPGAPWCAWHLMKARHDHPKLPLPESGKDNVSMLIMLTEIAVAEDRLYDPMVVADQAQADQFILEQARDSQVCNQGDWYVWRTDGDRSRDIAVMRSRPADTVAQVWTADRDEFVVKWREAEVPVGS